MGCLVTFESLGYDLNLKFLLIYQSSKIHWKWLLPWALGPNSYESKLPSMSMMYKKVTGLNTHDNQFYRDYFCNLLRLVYYPSDAEERVCTLQLAYIYFEKSRQLHNRCWDEDRSERFCSQWPWQRQGKASLHHRLHKEENLSSFLLTRTGFSKQMIPDESDDLWLAYNLIAPGDTVMAVTIRFVFSCWRVHGTIKDNFISGIILYAYCSEIYSYTRT